MNESQIFTILALAFGFILFVFMLIRNLKDDEDTEEEELLFIFFLMLDDSED